MALVLYLIIGLAAGYIAEVITGRDLTLAGNLVVGVLGAMLGAMLFGIVGLGAVNVVGRLVMATVGAALLLFLVNRFAPDALDPVTEREDERPREE